MVWIHSLARCYDSLYEEVACWLSLFDRRLIWNGCWKRSHSSCYYLDALTALRTSHKRLEAFPSHDQLLLTSHSVRPHTCFSAQNEDRGSLYRHAGSGFYIKRCSTKNGKCRQTRRRIRRSPVFPEGPDKRQWLLAHFQLPSCWVESGKWMTSLHQI
jgi:hypothetical protein